MEVFCVLPGTVLAAPPDAGQLRALCVLEGWSKSPLSVMPEAKNAVSDHTIPS
jgi:hypothetical protein